MYYGIVDNRNNHLMAVVTTRAEAEKWQREFEGDTDVTRGQDCRIVRGIENIRSAASGKWTRREIVEFNR